jgi:hypothetical protein
MPWLQISGQDAREKQEHPSDKAVKAEKDMAITIERRGVIR